MSATNRGSERIENDCYETPQPLADFLVKTLVKDGFLVGLEYGEPGIILEPSAGNGRFVSSLTRLTRYDVAACDIVLSDKLKDFNLGSTYCFEYDFLQFRGGWYDAIVGNPPYTEAEAHIRHGLELLRPNGILAFLLRTGFLGSHERYEFWKKFPAQKIYALSERPSFVKTVKCKGCGWKVTMRPEDEHPSVCPGCGSEKLQVTTTDASDYGFFVWRRGYTGPTTIEVVSWK